MEGLQRLAVTFSAAQQIADALSRFDQAEHAAAGWLAKVAEAQAEYSQLIEKMQRMTERHDAEVAAINSDAIAQRAMLEAEITARQQTVAELDTDISARQQTVAALRTQQAKLEAQRAKLAQLLNGA